MVCLIILPMIASAYKLLEPLPGLSDADVSGEKGLSNYLSWLFKFALAAAAFLAVLKIVIGGLNIIVGGASEASQKSGREMIEMALWGLLLAISSVLILTTINPDLVSTGFTVSPITIESKKETPSGSPQGPITWSSGPPPAGTYSADEARTILEQNNHSITVNKSECVAIGQSNCTSLYGLPKSTVKNLKDLAEHAKESFVITGGTEYWLHSTHGVDKPIVDIRYDSSLLDDINALQAEGKITSYQCERKGVKLYSCGASEFPDHFHIVFSS